MSDLYHIWNDLAEWSNETFGKDGPKAALLHLKLEVDEALKEQPESSEFAEEIADCFMLVLDAGRRGGLTLQNMINDLDKNR